MIYFDQNTDKCLIIQWQIYYNPLIPENIKDAGGER